MKSTPIAQTHNHPAGMSGEHPQGQYETDVADLLGGVGVAADTGQRRTV